MEYLFIGGAQDGKRHYIPSGMMNVRFPVYEPQIAKAIDETEPISRPEFKIEDYKLIELACPEVSFKLYALSGMYSSDVIRSLINNYSKNTIDDSISTR